MGRKHYGKRRNCSLRAISPFPTVFSKGLFPWSIKRYNGVVMVNPLPDNKILDWSKLKAFSDNKRNVNQKQVPFGWVENIAGKGENAGE